MNAAVFVSIIIRPMSDRNLNNLHPDLKPKANQFLVQCLAEGINAFITCCYRSDAEQDAEYAKGRTTPGHIVTNARGGQSPHNCTLAGKPASKAFDFAIRTSEGSLDWDGQDTQWQRAIDIGEALGLYSGEHFKNKDYAHLEMPNWKVSSFLTS